MFTTMLVTTTGGALLYAKKYGKSDEELREILEKKYPERLSKKKIQENHENLQNFYNALKDDQKKGEIDQKFNAILRGGKSEVKKQAGQSAPLSDHEKFK